MKWKYQTICIATLGGLSLLFQACVYEDRSCCTDTTEPPDDKMEMPTLKVTFSHQQTDIPITSEDLLHAVVYLHDESGVFFDAWEVQNLTLDTEYDTGITPERSPFGVVAWINPDPPYDIYPKFEPDFQGGMHRRDCQLSLIVPEDRIFVGQMPWLLYGKVDRVAEEYAEAPVEIPLTLDNYVINLSASGLPAQAATYSFMIHDDGGTYGFDNTEKYCTPFHYRSTTDFVPVTRAADGAVELSLTMLRLDENSNATIGFRNETSATTLYPKESNDLTGLFRIIRRALVEYDFDRTHVYNIHLDYSTGGNSNPQVTPGGDPPGGDPGTDPGGDPPGGDPGTDPGTDPGGDPGTDPDPVVGSVTVYVNGMVLKRENHALVD